MGSWRSLCSRRDAVVILWPSRQKRPPIGVKLMMSSSAPPPQADRACTHLDFYNLNYCSVKRACASISTRKSMFSMVLVSGLTSVVATCGMVSAVSIAGPIRQ